MSRPARSVAGARQDIRDRVASRTGGAVTITAAQSVPTMAPPEPVELVTVVEPVPADAPTWRGPVKTNFVWLIPGDRGYELRLEIQDAANDAEARIAALEYTVPLDNNESRPLSNQERLWINTVEPVVRKDSDLITLGHEQALAENAKLEAQNTAFKTSRRLFAGHGIDIFNPQAFIDRVHAEAKRVVDDARVEADNETKIMVAALLSAQESIARAVESTRFAPPKPATVHEPDYSPLTVVAGAGVDPSEYPRLARANWLAQALDAPLTDAERLGRELLLKDYGVIERTWRVNVDGISPVETDGLKAFAKRIRAVFGDPLAGDGA